MSADQKSTGVVFYLADPGWLDAVLEHLRTPRPGAPEASRARRGMADAIAESGSIGIDGRVQLFFSPEAFDRFMEEASEMKPSGMQARGPFSKRAAMV